MRIAALLFFLLLTLPAAAAHDTASADSTKKIRRSEAFLCIGGPFSASVDYGYRVPFKKTGWFSANLRLGLGGDTLGTGLHFGGAAIVSPWRIKAELGGGLAFAQLDEWSFFYAGLRYEGKRGMLAGLGYTGVAGYGRAPLRSKAQLLLGWRF